MQKILLDEMGLNYICATAERFYAVTPAPCLPHTPAKSAFGFTPATARLGSLTALLCHLASVFQVSTVLSNMVAVLVEQPSVRLLKHIVRCYLRLSDNLRCATPPPLPRARSVTNRALSSLLFARP